ncbi:MAG TPA: hypothetical protein VN578_19820 [Candidatus Binatia bacterium]|jgi:hypothetical protein|nr:hypothetical protein [Candidatus Binatia bacterium]
MKLLEKLARWFSVPVLTSQRIWFAFSVAAVADAFQLVMGPLGWVLLIDDVLDVVAMLLITLALGFHPLLLPTFIIEAIPVADMLPTWTGCTAMVVMLRKRAQSKPPLLPSKTIELAPAAPGKDLPANGSATPPPLKH